MLHYFSGLTWEEAVILLPEGVIPACHNAEKNVTISGPPDKVMHIVDELKTTGVFARMVDSSGIAFHSYMLKPCEGALRRAFEKVYTISQRT